MKKSFTAAILSLVLVSLTGCQETPKEDLVKNKKEQDLEQEMKTSRKTEEDSARTAEILASVPAHYQEEMEADGVTVQVDADVHIPDTDKIISEKVKPSEMTQEQIENTIRYFAGDAACYPLGAVASKEELMDEIISLRQEIALLESGEQSAINEGDGTPEEQIAELKAQLKESEELYESSAEEGAAAPVSIQGITFDENGSIELQSDLGRAEEARILIYKDADRGDRIEFVNYSPAYNAVEGEWSADISGEEAVNKAQEVIKALELGDLEVMGMEKKAQVVDGSIVGYYDISYKRKTEGLDNFYLQENVSVQTDQAEPLEEYSAHMEQTKDNIQVDATGVIGMNMTMPPQVTERMNEDVSICSFDQVKEFLASNIMNKSWKAPGEKTYLKITQIYLSYMYVINKNNNQEYLTIPVWDFCGYSYGESFPENSVYNLEKTDKESIYKTTYLTINAVDGSIVSRQAGY